MISARALIALAACILGVACGQGPAAQPAATSDEPSFPPAISPYEPRIDSADFVAGIDNPYLPLKPGSKYVSKGVSEGEIEIVTLNVLDETKEIMGIECTIVKDVVTIDGALVEKTFDWFAQDRFGNVWYFGENSKEYEDGKFAGTTGSWEAGVDGAQAGIVMLGDPQVGDRYRQEYYAGEAEDMGEVVKLDAAVKVPAGTFDDVLVTKDWNPLEPKVLELKYYARDVGVILERKVKGGPKERVSLIKFESAAE